MNNPLVQPDPGLYIWTIVTFLVLVAALAKFAWRPLLEALERRQESIRKSLDDARLAKQELERLQTESQKILAEARRQAETILSETRSDAGRLRDELRDLQAAHHPGHGELLNTLTRAAVTSNGRMVLSAAGVEASRPLDEQADAFWWNGQTDAALEDEGRDYLQAQLHALHPKAADAVATASARRLIRSLEIVQLGGDPMAVEEDPWPAPYAYVLLDRPDKPAHREAIAARAARQFAAGLVAEAELLASRLAANTPALSGIGYREALLYRRGEIDEQKAIALSAGRSWEYARRQSTWFRSEPITATIHADPNRSVRQVANELLDHVHTIMSRRSG